MILTLPERIGKECWRCLLTGMKRIDIEYLYSYKVACCKWLDRRSVTMLLDSVEGMATTSIVLPAVKKDQRPKYKYLAQALSKCETKKWVALT